MFKLKVLDTNECFIELGLMSMSNWEVLSEGSARIHIIHNTYLIL